MRVSVLFGLVLVTCAVTAASAQVRVDGYTRKDGTYVAPHYRSAPDSTPTNNYSYPGNTNPYTGQTAPGTPSPSYVPVQPSVPLYGTPRSR